MHEASLVRDLLTQVQEIAHREGAGRVTAVRVAIGAFAGVEADLFELAYQRLAPDVLGPAAQLQLQRIPLAADCAECGARSDIEDFCFRCAECGSDALEIVQGEELMLEEITLELDDQ